MCPCVTTCNDMERYDMICTGNLMQWYVMIYCMINCKYIHDELWWYGFTIYLGEWTRRPRKSTQRGSIRWIAKPSSMFHAVLSCLILLWYVWYMLVAYKKRSLQIVQGKTKATIELGTFLTSKLKSDQDMPSTGHDWAMSSWNWKAIDWANAALCMDGKAPKAREKRAMAVCNAYVDSAYFRGMCISTYMIAYLFVCVYYSVLMYMYLYFIYTYMK